MTIGLNTFYRLLEALLVALLALMVALVFTNAVLRYAAGSSLRLADELPRFAFVWLTFLGAAVAHRSAMHVGMKVLITHMPQRTWPYFLGISEVMILGCCLMLLWGGVLVWQINATVISPIMGVPLVWVHGTALVAAGLMALTSAERLYRLFTGRITEAEYTAFSETEDDETIAQTRGKLE